MICLIVVEDRFLTLTVLKVFEGLFKTFRI